MMNENFTELSIVIPTFNEVDNIEPMINKLIDALQHNNWEVIFVDDDSPDGTANAIRKFAITDHRIRCLHRVGRRGLSTACIEGIMSSSAPYVAVIDADMQHDERLLPQMLQELKGQEADIIIGSRYVAGGSTGTWGSSRKWISEFATKLSNIILKAKLSDPMSGFFMINREAAVCSIKNGVSGIGFKILLDLFTSSPKPFRYKELPYTFREREIGESKLDTLVVWEHVMLLLDKSFGHILPARFIMFSLVGGSGIVIHLIVLALLFKSIGSSFLFGQSVATLVAMTYNFILNNILTYRDRRLRGWKLITGWFTFVLACSIGAFANVGIAEYLFRQETYWVISAVAGILVGAVWNYAITSIYTWKPNK